MILYLAFLILIIGVANAYALIEDFQSYDDGDDIADVGPWTNWSPPYEIRCAGLGGGVKVGVFHGDGFESEWFYEWDASYSAVDYSVSADVAYTEGADEWATAIIRLRMTVNSPFDYECYEFGYNPASDPAWLFLDYMWEEGGYSNWSYEIPTPIAPDEWHNIRCDVSGEDPVTFEVYFDDGYVDTYVETEYLAPAGQVGLRGYFIYDTYDLMVDNVKQEGSDVGVRPASLGEVKAAFR